MTATSKNQRVFKVEVLDGKGSITKTHHCTGIKEAKQRYRSALQAAIRIGGDARIVDEQGVTQ